MRLTQQQLETHLWGAANILRGKTAGQDYKNYILSLMFYKRLCDQWENEADEAIAEQERQQGRPFTDAQKAIFRMRGEHRFNLFDGSRWGDVLAASTLLGEKLTQAMRAVADANDELKGVFTVDWGNASIGKINSVLHGLEARIAAGTSTITDPAFKDGARLRKFLLVLANFPFSDEFWWLRSEQWLVANGQRLTVSLAQQLEGTA